jgi:LmbE family N-acetylglucosaminyl deacetylase
MGHLLVLFALALVAPPASAGPAARVRAVQPPVRLLWIGAHPDDEALIAPLFGPACVERGNDCAIVILTNGSAERAIEAGNAAALLHARLIQWDLPDVFDITQWGDRAALVSRLASLIGAERPTTIYTFDPRHGSSCHPAHREAGQLTLDALGTLGSGAPAAMLVETLIQRDDASQIIGFAPATPSATVIDATAMWHYLTDDAAIHASQFGPAQLTLLRNIVPEQRRVWLLPSTTTPVAPATCP